MTNKWQPIKTAPKDGSVFLLCIPKQMNLIVRCRYNTVHKYFITDCETDGGITRVVFLYEGEYWMALPKPPTQDE